MKIEIKTRLHKGIYKSSGGGQTQTIYSLKAGPRNLLKALTLLTEEREAMVRGYGNIGCGNTWMEINGEEVDDSWLSHELDPERLNWPPRQTRTTVAREWLDKYQDASK